MSDIECQKDELSALESIYTEDEFQIFVENGHSGGKFTALLSLASSLLIVHHENKDIPTSNTFEVEFLPPITLQFSLPEDYPSVSPPNFTLCCSWLSRKMLSLLCDKLDQLWQENKGMEVLFLWTQFLKEEALSYMNINDKLDISETYSHCVQRTCLSNSGKIPKNKDGMLENGTDNLPEKSPAGSGLMQNKCIVPTEVNADSCLANETNAARQITQTMAFDHRAVMELTQGTSLVSLLKEFNDQQRKVLFDKELICCQICFQEKLGQHCVKFDICGHVFCKKCVTEYFEVQIKDGNVHSLNCPEFDCKKQALPSLVKELVSPELFVKYDSVLLNSTLDTLIDIIYCPRTMCQYPVSIEPGEKMAHCPNCEYVFCVYCRMVYHGVAPCRLRAGIQRQLVQQYQNGNENERCLLEQKYGKKQIQNLIDTYMSETWIMDNSQNCPTCNVAIEKSQGCNKMVCWKCNTMFCWLCRVRLNQSAPYLHFNNPSSPCYNLLFHGVTNFEDDDDVEDNNYFALENFLL